MKKKKKNKIFVDKLKTQLSFRNLLINLYFTVTAKKTEFPKT